MTDPTSCSLPPSPISHPPLLGNANSRPKDGYISSRCEPTAIKPSKTSWPSSVCTLQWRSRQSLQTASSLAHSAFLSAYCSAGAHADRFTHAHDLQVLLVIVVRLRSPLVMARVRVLCALLLLVQAACLLAAEDSTTVSAETTPSAEPTRATEKTAASSEMPPLQHENSTATTSTTTAAPKEAAASKQSQPGKSAAPAAHALHLLGLLAPVLLFASAI